MLEAIEGGYLPTCMAGPPGTLNVFDPNIMHRASRPRPGMYRDAITLFFHPPTCQQKAPTRVTAQETASMASKGDDA